jgi:hypothetical protein
MYCYGELIISIVGGGLNEGSCPFTYGHHCLDRAQKPITYSHLIKTSSAAAATHSLTSDDDHASTLVTTNQTLPLLSTSAALGMYLLLRDSWALARPPAARRHACAGRNDQTD